MKSKIHDIFSLPVKTDIDRMFFFSTIGSNCQQMMYPPQISHGLSQPFLGVSAYTLQSDHNHYFYAPTTSTPDTYNFQLPQPSIKSSEIDNVRKTPTDINTPCQYDSASSASKEPASTRNDKSTSTKP